MKTWITAMLVGFFAFIVMYVDRYVLITWMGGGGFDSYTVFALLEGGRWEFFGTGIKAFFITSIILMGIVVFITLRRSVREQNRKGKALMKNWTMAAVIGIVVLVVGYVDAFVLVALLEGADWTYLGTGYKVFFITSITFMAIAAIAVPLYEKLRQW